MFYKNENNGWLKSNWIASKNWEYFAKDFSEDTDLEDGWIFRNEPPLEYLEWLEELKRQEEEINNEIENII